MRALQRAGWLLLVLQLGCGDAAVFCKTNLDCSSSTFCDFSEHTSGMCTSCPGSGGCDAFGELLGVDGAASCHNKCNTARLIMMAPHLFSVAIGRPLPRDTANSFQACVMPATCDICWYNIITITQIMAGETETLNVTVVGKACVQILDAPMASISA